MASRYRKRHKGRSYSGGRRSSFSRQMEQFFLLVVLGMVVLGMGLYAITNLENSSAFVELFKAAALLILLLVGLGVCIFAALKWYPSVKKIYTSEKNRKRVEEQFAVEKYSQSFTHMDWREFEVFVEYLYKKHGYMAEVTPGQLDAGVDVIAYKDGKRYAIQTKRYAAHNKVRRDEVQNLVGAAAGYDGAIFITTSDYTSRAYEYAAGIPHLELINAAGLKELSDTI